MGKMKKDVRFQHRLSMANGHRPKLDGAIAGSQEEDDDGWTDQVVVQESVGLSSSAHHLATAE